MWTEAQRKSFLVAAKPLMQWMRANANPHMSAIVTDEKTELVSGEMAVNSSDVADEPEAFLLIDLARELDQNAVSVATVIELLGLGHFSVNMALTKDVANAAREYFKKHKDRK